MDSALQVCTLWITVLLQLVSKQHTLYYHVSGFVCKKTHNCSYVSSEHSTFAFYFAVHMFASVKRRFKYVLSHVGALNYGKFINTCSGSI